MEADDIFRKRVIVVLGARSVGKSSLVAQYTESQFSEAYHPTIENKYAKAIAYGGKTYECNIIDTPGQDEFSILNAKYVIGIHGFVLVYSVTSDSSFDMIKILYEKILDFNGLQAVPVVLVGQKSDLPRRKVSTMQAQELAAKFGFECIETSARDNLNIDKVFELCIAKIENSRQPARQSMGSKGCMVM